MTESRPQDSVPENWVDLYAPKTFRPYLRLARMDRPIGSYLLFLPFALSWTLAVFQYGAPGMPGVWALVVGALGSVLMRGAGCTWNDFVDRDIDGQVERTAKRPIPSGQVTPKKALIFMVLQMAVALALLLTLNAFTIWLALGSLVIVAAYPFAKRFTYWPQIVLGLCFNWGALVGWSSLTGSLAISPILLYAGAIFWTVFYDTIYAYQDVEDDIMIGVKSTARRFGRHPQPWLRPMVFGVMAFWTLAVLCAGAPWPSLVALIAALIFFCVRLFRQVNTLDIDDSTKSLRLFRAHAGMALDMWIIWLLAAIATIP